MARSALVVAGHGSHLNPDSAVPVYTHADTIRDLGVFDEVREAFWKEEPAFAEVLRTLTSEVVYVVPLFMSTGYFTDRVIPRELRLTPEQPLDVDKEVHYTDPVGTHDAMTDVILHRAESITDDPAVGPGFGLAVVGHGTDRHDQSAHTTHYHADRIRALERFDDVQAVFMDEAPSVADIPDLFHTPDIVIVPLFVAEGYHTTEDIPNALGLPTDHQLGYDTPTAVDGHRLWYAGAVGTDPRMAGVILERATDAGAAIRDPWGQLTRIDGTP